MCAETARAKSWGDLSFSRLKQITDILPAQDLTVLARMAAAAAVHEKKVLIRLAGQALGIP